VRSYLHIPRQRTSIQACRHRSPRRYMTRSDNPATVRKGKQDVLAIIDWNSLRGDRQNVSACVAQRECDFGARGAGVGGLQLQFNSFPPRIKGARV
jgi:hypothetical protein